MPYLLRGIPAVLVPAFFVLMIGGLTLGGALAGKSESPVRWALSFILGAAAFSLLILLPVLVVFRRQDRGGVFHRELPTLLVRRDESTRGSLFGALLFGYAIAIAAMCTLACVTQTSNEARQVAMLIAAAFFALVVLPLAAVSYFLGR